MTPVEKSSLTVREPPNLRISTRSFWAGMGLLALTIASMTGATWFLATVVFRLDPALPVFYPALSITAQPRAVLFLGSVCLLVPMAALLTKYVWLVAVSRWLTKSEVAPWIGTREGRIVRLDRVLLDRLFIG